MKSSENLTSQEWNRHSGSLAQSSRREDFPLLPTKRKRSAFSLSAMKACLPPGGRESMPKWCWYSSSANPDYRENSTASTGTFKNLGGNNICRDCLKKCKKGAYKHRKLLWTLCELKPCGWKNISLDVKTGLERIDNSLHVIQSFRSLMSVQSKHLRHRGETKLSQGPSLMTLSTPAS